MGQLHANIFRFLRSCPDVQVNYGGVATPNSPHRVFVSEPAVAANVHIFGPGVEKGVKCNTPTHFNIDCREAGQGMLYSPSDDKLRW
jgi:hypothetical protein